MSEEERLRNVDQTDRKPLANNVFFPGEKGVSQGHC